MLRRQALWMLLTVSAAAAQMGGLGGGMGGLGIPTGRGGPGTTSVRPFLSTAASYDSGLITLGDVPGESLSSALRGRSGYGYTIGFGISGNKAFYRSGLSGGYRGRYRETLRGSGADLSSTDHSANVAYNRQLSQRMVFSAGQSMAWFRRNLGLFDNTGPGNDLETPTEDLIDVPTRMFGTFVGIGYAISTRLSVGGGGRLSRSIRPGTGLISNTSYGGGVQVSYALSRREAIGAVYSHSRFHFGSRFGKSESDALAGQYSRLLGRNYNLSASGGVVQTRLLRLGSVQLDPLVAELLGVRTALGPVATRRVGALVRVSLSRPFRDGGASVSYNRGISPGNGLGVVGQRESVNANINYRTTANWSFTGSVGRSWLKPFVDGSPSLANNYASVGTAYRIFEFVSATASFSTRLSSVNVSGFRQTGYRASVGLSFSPGEIAVPTF